MASEKATDVLTATQRQRCMSHNRGRDTRPELALRRHCWAIGLRYRLGSRVTGKPDFVFLREKIAVFVDGCFWHGCASHYKPPTTRSTFWKAKLEANKQRDAIVNRTLTESGWLVLRFWEHDLKEKSQLAKLAADIHQAVLFRRQIA